MIKKYIVPSFKGFQVGDLVRMKYLGANSGTGRTGDLGIIFNIGTESNSTFCYDSQTVISREYSVYDIYWQQEREGYPATGTLTEKFIELVWSNEKQTELASQIGLYEFENDMAGSVCLKYGYSK